MLEQVKVTPDEFKTLSRYVHAISGIYLDETKPYLIETRLGRLLRELQCSSYSELYHKAQFDGTKKVQEKIIDAITTGETSFFRDMSPFELLQHKILPDLIDRRNKKRLGSLPAVIRIWSAACSTGQEIYSIAMTLKELLGDLSKYSIKLVGTDISDAAVARASYATYNNFEMDRGLAQDKFAKYFTREKDQWKVKDEIRAMATFKKANLMDSFIALGRFDIIFCRNVAIYFTEEEKVRLFKKMESTLESDGYLIIGSTESLTGIAPQFEPKRYLRSVFYQIRTQ
jgi:chemotaxis protein methyltransferase CheR